MATAVAPRSLEASSARVKRVKLLDRLATGVITLGGLFIIAAVSFIFIFILAEALPLFRSARSSALPALTLPAPRPPAVTAPAPAVVPPSTESGAAPAAPTASSVRPSPAPAPAPSGPVRSLVSGVDEYQFYLYEIVSDGRVLLRSLKDGAVSKEFPVPSAAGVALTTGVRTTLNDVVAAGTSDGRILVQQLTFRPKFDHGELVDVSSEVTEKATLKVDPQGRPVRLVAYSPEDGAPLAAAVGADEIAVVRSGDSGEQYATLKSRDGETFTHMALGEGRLYAATERGDVYHWDVAIEPRLIEVRKISEGTVSALGFALGDVSLLVGDQQGGVQAWIATRRTEDAPDPTLVRTHTYPKQSAAIAAIAASPRDKSFVTAAADGSMVIRNLTSERTLLSFPADGKPVEEVLLSPKLDGLVARKAGGVVTRHTIHSPHPEVSWRALFGKVWYEGYNSPEYVWQSTGGTDDVESKFSLVPLIFGTIKATVYAMLFAIPIAILGALYTSQFMHPTVRSKVKPTVEIMAALPSVVVGFLAGLWLASRVERGLVPVLLMTVLLPAFGTAGFLLWGRLPHALSRRIKPGMEIALIVPLLVLGGLAATWLGPIIERVLLGGDARLWLHSALGLVYDQRNALVVGIAMGFAVIPIIFTIAEDSFSSVPAHLTAASLALGASRWQTATRVVLPTASPGIFSAIMIGFGRAVGETMIVLMATGNTPVLEWSLFNGMRTLSANIAVEISEAPYGGTLYRVLFLAGLALFILTFAVNTAAEIVRQRLRERYKVI